MSHGECGWVTTRNGFVFHRAPHWGVFFDETWESWGPLADTDTGVACLSLGAVFPSLHAGAGWGQPCMPALRVHLPWQKRMGGNSYCWVAQPPLLQPPRAPEGAGFSTTWLIFQPKKRQTTPSEELASGGNRRQRMSKGSGSALAPLSLSGTGSGPLPMTRFSHGSEKSQAGHLPSTGFVSANS